MPTVTKPMAADAKALRARRQEEVRAHIQSAKLVQRLQDIANGEVRGEPALLGVQVRAALGLLAKTVPDVQSISLGGDDGGPLQIIVKTLAEPK